MTGSNAERLESIKGQISELHGGYSYEVKSEDLDFLIDEAERAKRLDKFTRKQFSLIWGAECENKRLREALEFYATEINHSKIGSHSEVSYDKGRIARQALEESK